MKTHETSVQKELSIQKILCMIFIPSSLSTLVYVIAGGLNQAIPSLLLFYICAILVLFPFELGAVLNASKKEFGRYSIKSAFTNYVKMSWWSVLLYGSFLFAFAGIMSLAIAPLENKLFAPISDMLLLRIPAYFDWNNIEYIKQYSKGVLLLTCAGYFVLNVFVSPIIEELFFRGYLTSKLSRYENFSPLIITVLFSLYHFWLPFNNLFRISAFLPAALIAWRKKNIYIAIVFHCLCNFLSTVSFIVSVYSA
ncbi:MAG: lysostaphin resistance A-like protein [Christensenellales bacterium]